MSSDWNAIDALIKKREKARLDKNWGEADAIRDDLKAQNVQLNDREDVWQCGNMIGLYDVSYNIKDSAISTIMAFREEARAAKDYKTSDAVRDMLTDAGIEIKDREGTWWSNRDGRQGRISDAAGGGSGGSVAPPPHQNIGAHPTSSIRNGAGARSRSPPPSYPPPPPSMAGGSRASGGKGAIGAYGPPAGRLGPPAGAYGPPAYDGPYSGHGGAYAGAYPGPPLPPPGGKFGGKGDWAGAENVTFTLHAFLSKREEARNQSEWESADKIRDVLSLMGVHLKDKERRWYLPDGVSGDYPAVARW